MTVIVRAGTPTVIRVPEGPAGPAGPAGSGATIGVKNDGLTASSIVERINFTGLGKTVSGSGADVTIDIPGGSSVFGVNVRDYGAVGDNVANDGPAFAAAIAALKAAAVTGFGYGDAGSARLLVPKGKYYLGTTTLDLTHGLIIEGESVGGTGPGSTVLRWAAGTTGIRSQTGITTGATGVQTSVPNAGIATVRNLLLQGAYSGTEAEAHGIHMRAGMCVEDVSIYGFQGNGVHVLATAGGGAGSEGNANGFFMKRVYMEGNRHGFYCDGADVNASTLLACNAKGNRAWGFWDSSFLGNLYLMCHAAGNGWDGALGSIPTGTSYSGNRYAVIPGQETGASTNAPSGTTADNTWWTYVSAGGVYNGVPLWVSGTTFRAGGSYYLDNINARGQLANCYAESDSNPARVVSPNMALGGLFGTGLKGDGIWLRTSAGHAILDDVQISTLLELLGAATVRGNLNFYGSSLYNGNIRSSDGSRALVLSGQDYVSVETTAAFLANFQASGLDLASGKALSVNGQQVVGGRGTAVADAAALTSVDATNAAAAPTQAEFNAFVAEFNKLRTDLGATRTQLNTALARLRASTGHGLVAG